MITGARRLELLMLAGEDSAVGRFTILADAVERSVYRAYYRKFRLAWARADFDRQRARLSA